MTGVSAQVLELIILFLVAALIYACRLTFKLAWYKVKLWELRQDVARLEAYREEIRHRLQRARFRTKHHISPEVVPNAVKGLIEDVERSRND